MTSRACGTAIAMCTGRSSAARSRSVRQRGSKCGALLRCATRATYGEVHPFGISGSPRRSALQTSLLVHDARRSPSPGGMRLPGPLKFTTLKLTVMAWVALDRGADVATVLTKTAGVEAGLSAAP